MIELLEPDATALHIAITALAQAKLMLHRATRGERDTMQILVDVREQQLAATRESDLMKPGELCRHVIYLKLITHTELAARIGVNPGTLSSWKVGTQRPNAENVTKIIKICRAIHPPCERCK